MDTEAKRYELEKKIIKHIYAKSKDFNGDGNVNYPYAAGAFESVIYGILKHVPAEKLEQIKSEIIR